jgi:hypothetical protein
LLLDHSKLESTVYYFGMEVDDALEMAEQTQRRRAHVEDSCAPQKKVSSPLCCDFALQLLFARLPSHENDRLLAVGDRVFRWQIQPKLLSHLRIGVG